MVRYIPGFKANVEQLTSPMVSNVDDDRLARKEQVEQALKRLIRQALVQKNREVYVFLTDEEQAINRIFGTNTRRPKNRFDLIPPFGRSSARLFSWWTPDAQASGVFCCPGRLHQSGSTAG